MLAIAEYMKSQGYAPAEEEHTRIPGIWKKLGSLYNLPALDERVSLVNALLRSHLNDKTGRLDNLSRRG